MLQLAVPANCVDVETQLVNCWTKLRGSVCHMRHREACCQLLKLCLQLITNQQSIQASVILVPHPPNADSQEWAHHLRPSGHIIQYRIVAAAQQEWALCQWIWAD